MTTSDALHQTLHHFYRTRDAQLAVTALCQLLEAKQVETLTNASVFHAFGRIAEVSEAARTGFASLSALHPKYIAAVLEGSRNPQFPRVKPEKLEIGDLDLHWSEFLVTGDTGSVRQLVAVLDWPDLVRAKLSKWLQETGTGFFGRRTIAKFQPLLARCSFPINYETRTVDGPFDCDLQTAISAKNRLLKFAELPFPLSQDEAIRVAMKLSALWSLNSNAQQHELVARVCEEEAKRPGGAARSHLAPRAGA